MRRRAIIGALLLVCVGVVLGTTVFRTDIAEATGLAQSVTVANTPLPVREQNLDGGNIKVHEQGQVSIHPVVPGEPWHRVRIVNVGSSPFLNEPSSAPINITSLTVAQDIGGAPGGTTAFLTAVSVPDSAIECSGDVGDILWATTMVTSPVAVAFPTPLVASAPAGSKVCLRASASGESGDHVWFSLSGFFGNE